MRQGDGTPLRWFNLSKPITGDPEYITCDHGYAPHHWAAGFTASLPACFTHWTYVYHGRRALICGFRGCDYVITDPIIMDDQ